MFIASFGTLRLCFVFLHDFGQCLMVLGIGCLRDEHAVRRTPSSETTTAYAGSAPGKRRECRSRSMTSRSRKASHKVVSSADAFHGGLLGVCAIVG